MKEPQSNLEENVNPSILKDDFSSKTDPFEPVALNSTNRLEFFRSDQDNYIESLE